MKTNREKHGLRGTVKSVHIETAQFQEQDGQILEKPWFSHTMTFNPGGWLTEQVNRNPDGSEWRTVNDYSESGLLLASRTYDPADALSGEVQYCYDEAGKLVAEQFITQDGETTSPTIYTYESNGEKIKIREFDFAGEMNLMIGIEGTSSSIPAPEAKRIETRYDHHGEAVEVKIFNTTEALVSRVEITRDARGNPLEETQYIGDTLPFRSCSSDSCSTEEIAPLSEEEQAELAAEMARLFSPGTVMSKYIHRYDVEGKLIESTLTMMDMEASRQTFAYDKAGNKSEEVSYNHDGMLEGRALLAHEYDEYGNWTKEVISTALSADESTPVQTTRRIITYW